MAIYLAALQGEMNRRGARITAHDLKFGAEHFVEHQRQVDAVRSGGCAAHTDGFIGLENFVECLRSRTCHDCANGNAFPRSADPAKLSGIEMHIRISQRLIQYEGAVPVS